MLSLVCIVSFIQVASDLVCASFSAFIAFVNERKRLFYSLNFLSFAALAFADIYYNYAFRILKLDILLSSEFISVAPLMIFQVAQLFNWYILSKQQNVKIISYLNLPYLLFCAAATIIIAYFFFTTDRISIVSTSEDVLSVVLDILVWFFTIICFGRIKNNSIALMALGCMMIVTASLTMTCLFRFDMYNVEITEWPHIIWTIGALLMAIGHIKSIDDKDFEFYAHNSMHVKCSWWLLFSSLFVFIIGFGFTLFFNGTKGLNKIHYVLWNVPVSLMFTMIISSIFGNRFSYAILSPINSLSQSIESFNVGEQYEIKVNNNIKELKILEKFIEKSFAQISEQLDREIKISAQVAHDIRSPLAALQIGINLLPSNLDESSRILLRDAIQNIRDIANSLDKNNIHKVNEKKQLIQIAVVLDSVISERRLALGKRNIKVNQNYDYESYGYFTEAITATIKRILSNLLNNAYEALNHDGGEININLLENDGFYLIDIIDNGCGISNKNLKFLCRNGFTTKKNGSGLGLYHAKEALAQWGAMLEIFSIQGKGTKIRVKLPIASQPFWFINKLILNRNEKVVCVDDNQSIWQSWQERFKSYGYKNSLVYCSSKENFIEELKKNISATYLIDFEFSGKNYRGYDLVDLLLNNHIQNRIYFVTSYSGKEEVQEYCETNSIKIIPKNYVAKIPIELLDEI